MSERPCPVVCDRTGCSAPAAKMPELLYFATGHPRDTHAPLHLAITLALCEAHASDAAARELTGFHHATVASYALSNGKALPDRATAEVKWWAIGDDRAPHRLLWGKAWLN